MKFKTITIRNDNDLKEVEKLVENGWNIGNYGFDSITLYYGKSTKY